MGEYYKEYRKRLGASTSGLSDWLWRSITFSVSSLLAWLINNKWLNVVSGDWVEIVVPISIGVLLTGIHAYLQFHRSFRKAAWEDSNQQQEEIERLRGLLDTDDLEHNLPFEDAIKLIREIHQKGDLPDNKIEQQMFKAAHRKQITVWGLPPLQVKIENPKDHLVEIPHRFFFNPASMASGGRGYGLHIGTPEPNWKDWKGYNKFFYVTVNRRQIEARFAR